MQNINDLVIIAISKNQNIRQMIRNPFVSTIMHKRIIDRLRADDERLTVVNFFIALAHVTCFSSRAFVSSLADEGDSEKR